MCFCHALSSTFRYAAHLYNETVNYTQRVDQYWIIRQYWAVRLVASFVLPWSHLALVADPALSVLPLPGPGYVGDCLRLEKKMSHTLYITANLLMWTHWFISRIS